jgi:hypothetical protein
LDVGDADAHGGGERYRSPYAEALCDDAAEDEMSDNRNALKKSKNH